MSLSEDAPLLASPSRVLVSAADGQHTQQQVFDDLVAATADSPTKISFTGIAPLLENVTNRLVAMPYCERSRVCAELSPRSVASTMTFICSPCRSTDAVSESMSRSVMLVGKYPGSNVNSMITFGLVHHLKAATLYIKNKDLK